MMDGPGSPFAPMIAREADVLHFQRQLAGVPPAALRQLVAETRAAMAVETRGSPMWHRLEQGLRLLGEEARRRGLKVGLPRGRRPAAAVTAREKLVRAARSVYVNHRHAALALLETARREGAAAARDKLLDAPEQFGRLRAGGSSGAALVSLLIEASRTNT